MTRGAEPAPLEPPSFGPVARWVLFFAGLWIMTVGVALSVHADLGTSPISTVPTALAAAIPFTFGQITIAMNLVFVAVQIVLLRRRFAPINLLQIVVAFVFGAMCDVSLRMTDFLEPANYAQQWGLVLAGAVFVSLGVFVEVLPRVLYVPGEGIVAAIVQVTGWRFGTVKQCFDWTLVLIAVALSLLLVGGLVGVREGTVFAAFAVGGFVKIWQRLFDAARRRLARG